MKRHVLIFILLAFSGKALAADEPQGSKFDNRIQYVNFNPGDVVVVRTASGLGTRVVFSPDETIVDVASGFSQGWDLPHRKNILYIKAKSIKVDQNGTAKSPVAGEWNTNVMVTTNLRIYDLDLQLLGNPHSNKSPANERISYRVEFRYPSDNQAADEALANKKRKKAALDVKPTPNNWNYSMQIGDLSENIAPKMAYDDGRFTYLKFPNNRDFPSAFLVAMDKTESLVNSHIDPTFPDTLVLHRVSKEIVLRLGKAVVGIYNDSFDPDGIPPVEGTTVPGVKRTLKAKGNDQ